MVAIGGACAVVHSVVIGKSDACPVFSLQLQPVAGKLLTSWRYKQGNCRSFNASPVLGTPHRRQSDPVQNCCHHWRSFPGCWHACFWSRDIHYIQQSAEQLACTTAIPKGDVVHTHVDPSHPYHLALPRNLAEDAAPRLPSNKYAPPQSLNLDHCHQPNQASPHMNTQQHSLFAKAAGACRLHSCCSKHTCPPYAMLCFAMQRCALNNAPPCAALRCELLLLCHTCSQGCNVLRSR